MKTLYRRRTDALGNTIYDAIVISDQVGSTNNFSYTVIRREQGESVQAFLRRVEKVYSERDIRQLTEKRRPRVAHPQRHYASETSYDAPPTQRMIGGYL